MAVIQVSKIQMRRGYEIDIPGAPTSLDPLNFGPSLDIGEIGYSIDTGRLFIGHDPSNGQPNDQRTAFPYQNIEILTENASTTLKRIHETNHRDVGSQGYFTATLVANTTDMTDVQVETPTGHTILRLDGEKNMATIEYFVFGLDNRPLRTGTLRFLTEQGSDTALMLDYSLWSPQLTSLTNQTTDPTKADDNVAFAFTRAGGSSDLHYRFQYTNATSESARLFFSIQRPQP